MQAHISSNPKHEKFTTQQTRTFLLKVSESAFLILFGQCQYLSDELEAMDRYIRQLCSLGVTRKSDTGLKRTENS